MWWPQKQGKIKKKRERCLAFENKEERRWWFETQAQSIDMPKHKSNRTRLKGVSFYKNTCTHMDEWGLISSSFGPNSWTKLSS